MEIAAIHRDFQGILRNYIAKRISNATDAEDILQEVFIKIHNSKASLSKAESLKSWIFTLTRNTIIDHYRKNGRKNIVLEESLTRHAGAEESDSEKVDLERCIHRFINELPEDYRQIIVDSEISGVRQKELAAKYDLAYPSVRSRVQRGRARLKEMFLECCKIEFDSRGNVMNAIPRKGKC
jgi:RNA polymerase sigma-70 factor, ECF subfamily